MDGEIIEFPRSGAENRRVSIPSPVMSPNLREDKRTFDGIISGPMWNTVSNLGSGYTDTLDWSIYDRLYSYLGDRRPREGVVFKTTLRLVNHHSSCSKCHYAFEVDTYGRGCIHNCTYCYAKDQLTSHGAWNRPFPMPVDFAALRKIFFTVFETDRRSKWREILESKIPLRIGSMSDSFMWMDLKYRVTYEFLRLLKYYRYPYIVFTRSDLVAHDDYLAVMDPKLASIQFSISGDNEELTKKLEPGAPSISRRLIALQKLSEHGYWTTVRINPIFPTFPDGYFTNSSAIRTRFGSKDKAPKFDLLDITRVGGFLDAIAAHGVPSVLAGFVRLSSSAIKNMSKSTGVDLKSFFDPEIIKRNGDKHYSDSEIAFYYKVLHSECEKRNLRFSVCYIGNGLKDYYQYQNLWSNLSDCCDARGNVASFKTSSQEVPWETRHRHAIHKDVALQAHMAERNYNENPVPC